MRVPGGQPDWRVGPARAPSINSGGVVNAAAPGAPVALGSIASVYGNFLLSAPSGAPSVPLPTSLGGLSLAFGATEVPLFYVSSGQVNGQIPWELAGGQSLTATVAGQTSVPQTINLAPYAPGIFTVNGQGTGAGAILDDSYHLITSSNPAAGITTILLYCTGLGPVTYPPPTGAAATSNPLSQTIAAPTVTIGGVPAQVAWSGLAPDPSANTR